MGDCYFPGEFCKAALRGITLLGLHQHIVKNHYYQPVQQKVSATSNPYKTCDRGGNPGKNHHYYRGDRKS